MSLLPKHVPNDRLYATKWLMAFDGALLFFTSFDVKEKREVGLPSEKAPVVQEGGVLGIFHCLEDMRLNKGFYPDKGLDISYEFRQPVWDMVVREVSEYIRKTLAQETAADLIQGHVVVLAALQDLFREKEGFEKRVATILKGKAPGYKERSWAEHLQSSIYVDTSIDERGEKGKNSLNLLVDSESFKVLKVLVPKIHAKLQVLVGGGKA